jgi:hypothetical protein
VSSCRTPSRPLVPDAGRQAFKDDRRAIHDQGAFVIWDKITPYAEENKPFVNSYRRAGILVFPSRAEALRSGFDETISYLYFRCAAP